MTDWRTLLAAESLSLAVIALIGVLAFLLALLPAL